LAFENLTPAEFYKVIVAQSSKTGISCLELITDYMHKRSVDPDYLVSLIGPDLKKVLAREAAAVNLLKLDRTKNVIPGI